MSTAARFEAIEASRKSRGEPDPTIGQRPMPSLAILPTKGVFKRSFYAWKSNPQPPTLERDLKAMEAADPRLKALGERIDALGRRLGLGSGGGPGRGTAGMSPEKRQEVSRKANAARWGR